MFGNTIDTLNDSEIKLGDLIESVDNRGKTPPLSDEPTAYPIIDVRALSGNSRIIDYTNCTKKEHTIIVLEVDIQSHMIFSFQQ